MKPKQVIDIVLRQFCKKNDFTLLTEFRFHSVRRFRFDWYILDLKCGIEYEGIMSNKSRHTNIKGFSTDCEKYNLAQISGYKVLRYTVLNYSDLQKDLEKIIK